MSDTRKAKQASTKHELCLKQIRLFEANDYVVHFCGLDCYQQWHDKARQKLGGPLIYNPVASAAQDRQ